MTRQFRCTHVFQFGVLLVITLASSVRVSPAQVEELAVPDLEGLTQTEATEMLASLGLKAGRIQGLSLPGFEPLTVYAQEIDPGTRVPHGDAVDLYVATERGAGVVFSGIAYLLPDESIDLDGIADDHSESADIFLNSEGPYIEVEHGARLGPAGDNPGGKEHCQSEWVEWGRERVTREIVDEGNHYFCVHTNENRYALLHIEEFIDSTGEAKISFSTWE